MPRQPFPGTITAVVAQKRTRRHLGTRVNVFIGEKFSFALDLTLAERHGLRPGFVIDRALLDELLREDGDARAYARALHFLSYRLRTRREIEERLERDEWPPQVVERVLARLQSEGQVNDENFAAAWVESRSLSRPRGARALQFELRQKGVARENIQGALPDTEQEIANAAEALRRKEREYARFDERTRRDKMLAFLQRRGFNYSTAKAALSRLQDEEESA
jgi:regulatory protein